MWAGSPLLFDGFSKYVWNKDAEALAEAVPSVINGKIFMSSGTLRPFEFINSGYEFSC